jgi:hypothetical protein
VNASVPANGHAYVTGRSNSVAFHETFVAKHYDFVGCALNMLKSKRAALERHESFQCGCCKPLPERELSLS